MTVLKQNPGYEASTFYEIGGPMNRAERLYAAIEKGQTEAVFEHLWAAVGRTEQQRAQMAWLTHPQGEVPFELDDLKANRGMLQEALFRSMRGSPAAVVHALSALERHLIQGGCLRPGLADFPLFHIEEAVAEGTAEGIVARLAYEDPATLAPLVVRACQRGQADILALMITYATPETREAAHGELWAHPPATAMALCALLGEDPLPPAERLMRLIEAQRWSAADAYASAPVCPLEIAQAALHLVGHRATFPCTRARVRQGQLLDRPAPAALASSRRRA